MPTSKNQSLHLHFYNSQENICFVELVPGPHHYLTFEINWNTLKGQLETISQNGIKNKKGNRNINFRGHFYFYTFRFVRSEKLLEDKMSGKT